MSLSLNLYQSMALAVAIFYFGAFLKSKISVFRTYCIPSPVIGGIIYAIVNLILYQTGVLQLSVDTDVYKRQGYGCPGQISLCPCPSPPG